MFIYILIDSFIFIKVVFMLSLIVALLIILNPVSTVPAYVSMYPHTKTKQLIRDAATVAF